MNLESKSSKHIMKFKNSSLFIDSQELIFTNHGGGVERMAIESLSTDELMSCLSQIRSMMIFIIDEFRPDLEF
jgi:hypothetical protein